MKPQGTNGEQPNTTAPQSEAAVTASRHQLAQPAAASLPDPEFVDAKGLRAGWGITRSLAYALLADGEIEGVSIRRRRVQVRGKRLFKVDSVRAFLRSQMEPAKPEDAEAVA